MNIRVLGNATLWFLHAVKLSNFTQILEFVLNKVEHNVDNIFLILSQIGQNFMTYKKPESLTTMLLLAW